MSFTQVDSLQQRVSALEQAIAGLQGSEALQPNYLTVSPSGQVGANFSGKITASELDLIGGAGASPIKWVTTGGALLAELTVDASGDLILSPAGQIEAQGVTLPEAPASAHTKTNSVTWVDGGGNSQEYIQGINNGGVHQLIVASTNAALVVDPTSVVAQAGGQIANLLDSSGGSSFIQNYTGSDVMACNVGNSAFTGNGASNITFNIAHGLGRVPAFFTVVGKGWQCICNYQDGSSNGTNASVQLQVYSGVLNNGQNFNYTWLAIG